MSDHVWIDDALQSDGHAWVAGVRFRCARGCGVEKRAMFETGFHVMMGHATETKLWLYFLGPKRVGSPTCRA